MHFKQMKRVGLTLAVFVVVGCGSGEPSEADKQEVVDQYAVVVFESYKESLETATQLDTKIRDFTAAPDSTKFQAAKDAWLVARNPYGQTEGYRFYGGPIDNEEDGPEGLINAWPLDENYIDYTRDANGAGLVNGTAPLTKELLVAQNEKDGEKNISTGYHAIEFLLWGQDAIDPANELPGQRPHTDYLDMASGGTAPNADRRSQYLELSSSLLLDHLQQLHDAWAPDQSNFRSEFVAKDVDAALTDIFNGIGNLSGGELSGERMAVALENQDQEDEHSCFADNTHNDILMNAKSVQNIYLGTYGSSDGPGLDTLVAAVDSDLDERIQSEMEATITAINAIPVPFDKALTTTDGQAKIQAAIDALRTQTDSISEAADALGLTLTLE